MITPQVPVPTSDPTVWEDPDLVLIETFRKPGKRASDERRRQPITTSGTGMKGKTPVAVYSCSIPETPHDTIYDKLCPRSLGWNIAFNHPETRNGRTTWTALIANAKSTGQADLIEEIIEKLGYEEADVEVLKIMGVGFIGGHKRVGVPRAGVRPKRRGKRGEITNGRPFA